MRMKRKIARGYLLCIALSLCAGSARPWGPAPGAPRALAAQSTQAIDRDRCARAENDRQRGAAQANQAVRDVQSPRDACTDRAVDPAPASR